MERAMPNSFLPKTLNVRQILLGLALVLAAWLALAHPGGLSALQGQSAGAILITLVLWATGLIPPFLTALIFFAAILVLRLDTPANTFAGFGSAAVWLIISGFVIGAAIAASGLSKRLAALLAPMIAHSYLALVAGLTITAMLLGFVMPSSIGRAIVLVPIGMALAEQAGFEKGSNGRIGIAVALAIACNVPSFAILPSNIPNMILAGAAEQIHHQSFSYTDYLALHYPLLGLVKSAITVALVLWLYPDRVSQRAASRAPEPVTAEQQSLQVRVGVILLATLALWMTDSLHGINPAWVGIVAAVVLLLPGVGVVAPKNFNASIDFGTTLFVAAALSLGALINSTGLGTMLGATLERVLPLAEGRDFLNFMSLTAMSFLTALVTTIPGVPTVLTPMAQTLADHSGMSLPAVLMTQVIGFSTLVFPYQVGPIVVAMNLSGERLGAVLRITLPLAAITLLVLAPLDYLWWGLLGWL